LRTGCEIHDGQTAVPEIDTSLVVNPAAFPVRPTMGEHLDHSLQIGPLPGSRESSNSAHKTKRKVALR
jgi:hypothetical protein